MSIEFEMNDGEHMLLGIQFAHGEDPERGMFHMLAIGLLFFTVSIYSWK